MLLLEREPELRALLAGQKLLAFHCTRLREQEVDRIREEGLLCLSSGLVSTRIEAAHGAGDLTGEERDRLTARSVYALENTIGRDGRVCCVLGRGIFDGEGRHGCLPLLQMWGGEAIYWGVKQEDDAPRLGRPSIVVVRLDAGVDRDTLMTFPGLGHLFVGIHVGAMNPYGEAFVRADIPPEDVLDIWQPGHPEYDRHRDLPQS